MCGFAHQTDAYPPLAILTFTLGYGSNVSIGAYNSVPFALPGEREVNSKPKWFLNAIEYTASMAISFASISTFNTLMVQTLSPSCAPPLSPWLESKGQHAVLCPVAIVVGDIVKLYGMAAKNQCVGIGVKNRDSLDPGAFDPMIMHIAILTGNSAPGTINVAIGISMFCNNFVLSINQPAELKRVIVTASLKPVYIAKSAPKEREILGGLTI